jgi:flagellar hook-associated protein FlgK
MGIGTFGSFTQARLAIYAAQTGLNVTGNNISNINTPGYTRQRLDQVSLYTAGSDRYYAEGDVRTGQGALVKSLSQIRNPYLDIRFRAESAKVGYMDSKMEGLKEIAMILDEVGKGDISKGEDGFGILGLEFNKIATALRDLVSETGHQEYDDTVRQTAKNLIAKFNTYASKLEEVRESTVKKLDNEVSEINNYLTTIRSLNEEIRKCDIHGDPALELRDERNRQIDALSQLIDINVTYSEEEIAAGMKVEKLTITLDNANPDKSITTDESLLVDGIFSAQLSFGTPELNDKYDPNLKPGDPGYEPKYLKADGTATDDLREANILKDEENPLYGLMISELKNKVGDLHVNGKTYAAQTITQADLPAGLAFNAKTNQGLVETADQPDKGDKTITIYTRTLKPNAPNPPTDADYTYTKQVYEQILTKPVALDDNDINGSLQAHRELLTEEGEFTDLNVIANIDEGAGGKRGIPYYQKTLDLLANRFAQVLNDANQGYLMDPDGNYITKGQNADGKDIGVAIEILPGEKINKDWDKMSAAAQGALEAATGITYDKTANGGDGNSKEILDAYLKANGGIFFQGGVLFSNNPGNDDPSNITAANISISNTWDKTHLLVRSFTCPPGDLEPASGQSDNLTHMGYLLDFAKFDYVPTSLPGNGNASSKPMFTGTFFEMWNNIGTVLGEDQTYTNTMLNTYYENALAIDTERDAVSSVDFNDEAMNLMMYAKSYNAACRLMTTIDSVLDKLINNTGLTT